MEVKIKNTTDHSHTKHIVTFVNCEQFFVFPFFFGLNNFVYYKYVCA